ncbi:MAG: hypothetical protein ACRD7E_10880 [Bryobacteraceae bacterium]
MSRGSAAWLPVEQLSDLAFRSQYRDDWAVRQAFSLRGAFSHASLRRTPIRGQSLYSTPSTQAQVTTQALKQSRAQPDPLAAFAHER